MSWKFLLAEDREFAARGMVQARQSSQQRGLSGAVVAEDGVKPAAGKIGGHAAQGGESAQIA